jgi:hypothetical protein
MDVVKYRTTLCVGESAPYTVFVYRQSTTSSASPTPVDRVQVLANPFDDQVGRFLGKDRFSFAVVAWTGPGTGASPMPATFTFKAGKKPGKTTLLFRANAHGTDEDPNIPEQISYVSFQVDIRVIQCRYTVKGSTSFPPDARDNPDIVKPPLVATLKKVQLVSDADGHLTGSTSIHWKSARLSSGCIVNETFGADGAVTINGDVGDDGTLTLTLAFTSVAASATETCGPASVGFPVPHQIDPLRLQVPMKGGVVTPRVTLAGFPGVATIIVKPVKEG